MRMHKFVYILYFSFFFVCDKYPKLTDMAHIPSAESNYNGTNTNLPSIFVKMFIEYSNIKSTSLNISDLSVNSQKTLKLLFTVDCK